MANPGTYLAVVRNDGPLPVVIHDSIRPDSPESRTELDSYARMLHSKAGGKIPFAVSILVHTPSVTQPSEVPVVPDIPGRSETPVIQTADGEKVLQAYAISEGRVMLCARDKETEAVAYVALSGEEARLLVGHLNYLLERI